MHLCEGVNSDSQIVTSGWRVPILSIGNALFERKPNWANELSDYSQNATSIGQYETFNDHMDLAGPGV
jgi:hypothetical protein